MRVGIDLIRIAEVEASLACFGERYARRLFTPAEIADCQREPAHRAARFAARFAAKEAARKVLRDAEGLPWTDLEVVRHPTGWVELALRGQALSRARAQGLGELALSLSHEAEFAVATVVAATPSHGAAP